MTSSGIGVSKALEQAFADARAKNDVRFLECDVVDEAFTCVYAEKLDAGLGERGQWAAMHARCKPKQPFIYLYRLDRSTDQGFAWAFVS